MNSEINKLGFLNEFEIKTLYRVLNDYDVINIAPRISDLNQTYYIIFIKREEFIFSCPVFYSKAPKKTLTKPDFSDFISLCFSTLQKLCKTLDSYVINNNSVDTKVFDLCSLSICNTITQQLDYFYKMLLVEQKPDRSIVDDTWAKCKSMLYKGEKPKDIFNKFYKDYKIDNVDFFNGVVNCKGNLQFLLQTPDTIE